MGARLIIVSNRVAVPETPRAPLAGGMAVAVKAALLKIAMGCGSAGAARSRMCRGEPTVVDLSRVTYALIDLSQNDFQEYYNGLANSVLWPIFHYRVDFQEYSRADQSGYMRVNRLFAESLRGIVQEDDVLGTRVSPDAARARTRSRGHQNPIGFFLHTPCAPPDILQTLPHHGKFSGPDPLRSGRFSDRARSRQFRPLHDDVRRDPGRGGAYESRAGRCVSAPFRSASRPRPTCASRATPDARR